MGMQGISNPPENEKRIIHDFRNKYSNHNYIDGRLIDA